MEIAKIMANKAKIQKHLGRDRAKKQKAIIPFFRNVKRWWLLFLTYAKNVS